MGNPWHDLAPGAYALEHIRVVVKLPKGGRVKYAFNSDSGIFRLERVLGPAAHTPGDYGFIPQTFSPGREPLDALVLTNLPAFTGYAVAARPIGLFRTRNSDAPDDKIIAVLAHDPLFADYQDIADLPAQVRREIEHFFAISKNIESTHVEPLGWGPAAAAKERISFAATYYAGLFGNYAQEVCA